MFELRTAATSGCTSKISRISAGEREVAKQVPTLFDWLGGAAALDRLTANFYVKVRVDPLLAPVFAHGSIRTMWRSFSARSSAGPRITRGSAADMRTC